jgi:uncharacterized membrane protein YgdD (TMEM256/DUF423 family)
MKSRLTTEDTGDTEGRGEKRNLLFSDPGSLRFSNSISLIFENYPLFSPLPSVSPVSSVVSLLCSLIIKDRAMDGWIWVRIGAISGFLAVALGAFGAHGLRDRLKPKEADSAQEVESKQRRLENFETASRYQMYHALALLALGFVVVWGRPTTAADIAGWAFLAGTIVFSGSLSALGLSGVRWLGAITPFGGIALLVGWIALAVAAAGGPRPGAP